MGYGHVVVPFDLTIAQATFMCLMNSVFNKYLYTFVLLFVDGILIFCDGSIKDVEKLSNILNIFG